MNTVLKLFKLDKDNQGKFFPSIQKALQHVKELHISSLNMGKSYFMIKIVFSRREEKV